MDLARRVHGGVAAVDLPRADLVGPDGEERDEPEQLVAGADDQREPVLGHAHLVAERGALLGGQRDDLALGVRAQRDRERVPRPSAGGCVRGGVVLVEHDQRAA